jgi:hypothetical protein
MRDVADGSCSGRSQPNGLVIVVYVPELGPIEDGSGAMMLSMLSLLLVVGTPLADNPDCPQGSACQFGNTAVRDLRRSDANLERAQHQLLDAIHDKKVVDAQNLEVETVMAIEQLIVTWRPDMEAQCGVFGALTGGASPWKSAWKVACESDQTDDRVKLLKSVAACLRRPRTDGADPGSCIYPLTPSLTRRYYEDAE